MVALTVDEPLPARTTPPPPAGSVCAFGPMLVGGAVGVIWFWIPLTILIAGAS